MMMLRFLCFVLVLTVVPVGAAGAGDVPAAKPAAPDAATVRRAGEVVQRVYQEELANARDPASKSALARKMIQVASDERDAGTKYALLSKAIDLGVQAGDADLVSNAVDQIDATWKIDASRLRARTLSELSRHLGTPEDRDAFVRRAEAAADAAAAAKEFSVASELIDIAAAAAQRADDPPLVKRLSARASEFAQMKSAEARVRAARATLEAKPSDVAANLAVGECECFIEGDWPAGLPKLARGNNTELRSLAALDLKGAAGAPAQLALADQWWQFSQHQEGMAKRQIQRHAIDLYRKADPNLSGLERVRAEQRISTARPSQEPSPTTLNSSIRVANVTNAREASNVIADVFGSNADVLKGVTQATLLLYHNGGDFQRAGGALARIAGCFSPAPATSDSHSFLFWGVHERWKPGKYLVVYRMAPLSPVGGGEVCNIDIYADGDGLARHTVAAHELPQGRWSVVPMILNVDEPKDADYRMYTSRKQTIALDRVYVYELR